MLFCVRDRQILEGRGVRTRFMNERVHP